MSNFSKTYFIHRNHIVGECVGGNSFSQIDQFAIYNTYYSYNNIGCEYKKIHIPDINVMQV